jgi:hypothetical protein
MALIIADSFDNYSTISDMSLFWDFIGNTTLAPGRFSGSRSFSTNGTGIDATKTSGSNDTTHHFVLGFYQTVGSSSTEVRYIQLLDNTTPQCTIVFKTDGSITLKSGGTGGTILATYSAAFSPTTWQGFEIEVTINNISGSIHIRKNGNISDDFVATGLNTRGGTANNYANKLQIGNINWNGSDVHRFDDFMWFNTTGAAPNTWVGDVRALQLMPSSDASVQFSKSTTSYASTTGSIGGFGLSMNLSTLYASQITSTAYGTLDSLVVSFTGAMTGNATMALYADNSGIPGVLLATTAQVTNPTIGLNTFTFSSPPAVTRTNYWVAIITSANTQLLQNTVNTSNLGANVANTYGSGVPSTLVTAVLGQRWLWVQANITPSNSGLVNESQQDGDAGYVYSSNIGDADLYNIADLPFTPVAIIGVQTRAFVRKSDAGVRTGRIQIKSGGTTVTQDLVLSSSYLNLSRFDAVDPNTGAAWNQAGINALQIGPVVV